MNDESIFMYVPLSLGAQEATLPRFFRVIRCIGIHRLRAENDFVQLKNEMEY